MRSPRSGKFILVNVPSFELIAFQDGMPVLRSRVVVGKPAAPTPQLIASLTAIQFNPSWTPTPNMIRNEGLHYMPPGPQNPLGRMMFDMDDDEYIYLHDTPEKMLFKREQRALSHGCVRVEQARALAAWALGVSEEEIEFDEFAGNLFRAADGKHSGFPGLSDAVSRRVRPARLLSRHLRQPIAAGGSRA